MRLNFISPKQKLRAITTDELKASSRCHLDG